jgi:hypothetical protein
LECAKMVAVLMAFVCFKPVRRWHAPNARL